MGEMRPNEQRKDERKLLTPEEEILAIKFGNKTEEQQDKEENLTGNIYFVFLNTGLILIGILDKENETLKDVFQVVITSVQQQNPQSPNQTVGKQVISYQFVPFMFGLAKGENNITDEIDLKPLRGSYMLIKPKEKVIDDYLKLKTVLRTGIVLENNIENVQQQNQQIPKLT